MAELERRNSAGCFKFQSVKIRLGMVLSNNIKGLTPVNLSFSFSHKDTMFNEAISRAQVAKELTEAKEAEWPENKDSSLDPIADSVHQNNRRTVFETYAWLYEGKCSDKDTLVKSRGSHRGQGGGRRITCGKDNGVPWVVSRRSGGMYAQAQERMGVGWTPLHACSYNNGLDIAELLVDRGADINSKDDNGYTPLHVAASNNARDVAAYLIERGADKNAKALNGKKPLDVLSREAVRPEWIGIFAGKKPQDDRRPLLL
jgi:hypothetical protein